MKTKWIKESILLTAVGLMLCGWFYGNRLMQLSDTMSVKYQDAGLTASRIDELNSREEEPYVTGWRQTEKVKVTNGEGWRESTAVLTEVHGDMAAVCPVELLTGSFAGIEDEKGCVISSALAEKLFQDSQAEGCEVILGEKCYLVRGIMKNDEALLVVQSERDENFPNLELQYAGTSYPASNTKAELTQWGLPAYESFTEGNLYAGLGRLAMGFPFLIILLLITKTAADRLKNEEKSALSYVKKAVLAAAFLLLMCILLKYSVRFSEDYIPAQVSDFAFWSEKYKEVWLDYRGILKYRMGFRKNMILGALSRCIITSGASSILCMAWNKMK